MDTSQPTYSSPQSENPQTPNSTGVINTIGIVLLVAVVVGGGAYYFGTKNSKPDDTVAGASTAKSKEDLLDTSKGFFEEQKPGWKTYTNTKHHYSIQHPQELQEEKSSSPDFVKLVTADYEAEKGVSVNSGNLSKGHMITITFWPPTHEGFLDSYCETKKASNSVCEMTKIKDYEAALSLQRTEKSMVKEVTMQIGGNETVSIIGETTHPQSELFFKLFDEVVITFEKTR